MNRRYPCLRGADQNRDPTMHRITARKYKRADEVFVRPAVRRAERCGGSACSSSGGGFGGVHKSAEGGLLASGCGRPA